MKWYWIPLLVLLSAGLVAQENFQLLRSDPEGFARVERGRVFEFPADHLPHRDYRIEWWYLTANLRDTEGRRYGVQWTLFRQSASAAPDPGGWESNQLWMAHAALSSPAGHRYTERFARGGIGQAGVELNQEGRFAAWLDDWTLTGSGPAPVPGELVVRLQDSTLRLVLEADTPWVLQGERGYSQKSARGQASYYYSQPHIIVRGELEREGVRVPLEGRAWLDREWSSQPLAPDQPGWDWLSLHLDDGHALMVYRLRQDTGDHWLSGSWVNPDGEAQALGPGDLVFEPISTERVRTRTGSRELPLQWRVALPRRNLEWRVVTRNREQWLDVAFPYWEGPVAASGASDGEGYLELTGY